MEIPVAEGKAKIEWLDYNPSGHELDVEVFPFSDLRRRASCTQIQAAHRYAFYLLICMTEGAATQMVDFQPVACTPGSLLVLRPGQVHSFGTVEGWKGWLVLFRPEFLPSSSQTTCDLAPAFGLDELPNHLPLSAPHFHAVTEAIERMRADAAGTPPSGSLHTLLRFQLGALLTRLAILHDQRKSTEEDRNLQRFARFRRLVEQNHSYWHQVAHYARALGCTEKSLTRAALEATGRPAKEIIAARIALEAKRLLAHTDLPVYLIAESLGFDEATNFSKFFKREVGSTPVKFRQRQVTLSPL